MPGTSPKAVADAGLEQYDTAILDIKPRYMERQEADLAAVAAKLEAARPSVTDPRGRQDLDILIKSARDQAATSALNRRLMIPYIDVGKTVFQSLQLILDQRVSKKRQQAALVRLKRYAGTGERLRAHHEARRSAHPGARCRTARSPGRGRTR